MPRPNEPSQPNNTVGIIYQACLPLSDTNLVENVWLQNSMNFVNFESWTFYEPIEGNVHCSTTANYAAFT